ncbi:MAG: hypothetical protein DUD27_03305 [Lachnospiraceae bacterium]|uniref:Fibronectin type III domain-containing protein n=1 Tax=Candidatus Weimeria bifida TaxID=2599074 RepID=A0A6N7IY67_9FIRM|nr:hypothetical protein [Candidatus Weimeria bifida]RRF96649.1 MAG: hypothetical protein DUD27_03305 [Lachnospiraceae bacterium]
MRKTIFTRFICSLLTAAMIFTAASGVTLSANVTAQAAKKKSSSKKKSVKPGRVNVTYAKSLKAGQITVKWKKVRNAGKYYVQYAYNNKFQKAKGRTVSSKKLALTFSAKSNSTVYLRVKAVNGKNSGKYSSTKKVKVKKSAKKTVRKSGPLTPKLGKDGLYHCKALKYGYRLYTGISDKMYSGCGTALYIKTNRKNSNFQISFYDKKGNDVSGWAECSSYSDVKNGAYWTSNVEKVPGGYLTVHQFQNLKTKKYPVGNITVKISEINNNYPTGKMTLGTIKLEDTEAAHKAWVKDILKKSGANQKKDPGDKMDAVCNYLCQHTRYNSCFKNKDYDGEISYIITLKESTTPGFVKMVYDSFTSPNELVYIGKQIGYPLRSMYGDYKYGTVGWRMYHYYAIHKSDKRMFEFCPYTDTGLISDKVLTKKQAEKLIPQLNVKKLKPVTIK